ncbi:flippase-like domain-containing protein [Myxococcota bacterium]|nr:flippase-like domain-containing protein [Myxococcota bacterium]
MQRRIATWLGLALSVAFVWYIARNFDLAGALQSMAMAHAGWIAVGSLIYCLQFPLRGLRWAVLMRAVKPVRWATATEVFTIGFMANNLLPARLGDVARAFVLARRENVAASATFSNVMLERVFDGLTIVGFLFLVLVVEPPSAEWVSVAAWLMAAVFVGAVVVSALVAWQEERALRLARLVLTPTPATFSAKVVGLLERLGKGLHTLKSPKETAIVVALSLLIWTLEVVVYFFVQRAFGMSVSPLGLALVMAVLSLGLTAPSAPGFVGVYEGLVIKALAVYGVGDPLAPAFALTLHLIHFVPGTLLGLAFTWKSGLKLREIRTVDAEPDEASDKGGATLRAKEMELG